MSKLTIHDLTEKELLILYREVDDRKKSTAKTWLLWLFLFGAHHLYLGRKDTGWALLVAQGILLIWFYYLGGGMMGSFTPVMRYLDRMEWVPYILGGCLVIWRIVDVFLISGMLREDKRQVEGKVLEELVARRSDPKPARVPVVKQHAEEMTDLRKRLLEAVRHRLDSLDGADTSD